MKTQIVGIGEALWDVFPDGARFGGAPANFACAAANVGKGRVRSFVVSKVGRDDLGRRAVDELRQKRVDTSFVQESHLPTGRVSVSLDDRGQASYTFDECSAWDDLDWTPELAAQAERTDVVCFGTLGQRNERSRQAIRSFLQATAPDAIRVFDINLRPPYFSRETILDSIGASNVLKLNDDELPILSEMLELSGDSIEVMREIARRFELRAVALTRGADGAVVVSHERVCEQPGEEVDVVDTVGAGDAFTATLAIGLRERLELQQAVQRACRVAAFVCSQPGATPAVPEGLLI